jgi:CRP-like cAMP-binding protein
MTDTDDFDFTRPIQLDAPAAASPMKAARSRFYDAKAAGKVFREVGREERFEAGKPLFVEDEAATKSGIFAKGLRMYYIAEGEVVMTRAGRPLDTLKAGEVFGEMAVISELPRSATATARTACTVFSLDQPGLLEALSRSPEFGLMLASIMFERIRLIAARLAGKTFAKGQAAREATVFSGELMGKLLALLPPTAKIKFPASTIIMKEGQAADYMFVVKSGRVVVAVGSTIVEAIGPGGIFGEMALIDNSPRTARAGAVEDSELLAIDREMLLAVVKKQPVFGYAMLRGIADRLRHMNQLLA